ncbi:aminotransferase class V-fold PLP-dependent enzyme [Nocardioides mangrovi]|uniref:Aminotransferase class V-fold PLP-dependent enzyme n=1 Tax=Nocardioides mangrovi TaxID=2874580 RepID=A0ABS7UES1_9ACTN|nr:aminotransferase class V-fold PLP-dependent enzyme [Nocardioides mangrovi]MBZ5739350.1 aminotransferase class V-fold PLP-dependent enzyme [Nocardioides mangrovi]
MTDTGVSPGFDVAFERARTVGTTSAHHLNAAGAALPTTGVVEAVVGHLRREQRDGGYEASAAVAGRIGELYAGIARLVGAEPDEVALFDSATTGLRVLVDALRLTGPGRLLVSRSTYVSHALHLLTLVRERGLELVVLPCDATGGIDLEELERLLREGRGDTVCVAHVPTSSGLVEPVAAVGALARRHGARFLLDATQSVGQLAVDVDEIGCDALVTTGRKFLRAPRGTAFGIVRRGLIADLAPSAPDVRGADWTSDLDWSLAPSARRFETWESSVACRLGLAAAVDELLERGMAATERHLVAQGERLRGDLAAVPGVTVQDPPSSRSAIVTFTVAGLPADRVNRRLASDGVRTVSVPASHGQWDLGRRGVPAVVRASTHVYNDDADLDALVQAVARLAGQAAS